MQDLSMFAHNWYSLCLSPMLSEAFRDVFGILLYEILWSRGRGKLPGNLLSTTGGSYDLDF
jgi:hypothetical protein